MPSIEKKFIPYGSGITTDISQIPFDRFSDFIFQRSAVRGIDNFDIVDKKNALHSRESTSVFGPMIDVLCVETHATVMNNSVLSFETRPDNYIHHLVITIPKGSCVVITDELSANELYGSIVDVIVEEGATVHYQIDPKEKTSIACRLFRAYVKQNAYITWVEKVHHTQVYVSSFHTYLEQQGARGNTYGVFDQGQSSQTDIYAATYHLAPHTMSDSISKGVLRGSAKAVHRSLVHIASDAHDCEGYERQDTLLLSDSAQINAIPNLEINNNQVKCSHGATTTYIDDEKLFYFLSRGLDRKTAEELFVSGHIATIEEKFF